MQPKKRKNQVYSYWHCVYFVQDGRHKDCERDILNNRLLDCFKNWHGNASANCTILVIMVLQKKHAKIGGNRFVFLHRIRLHYLK